MNLKASEAENRDYLLEKIKIKIAKSLPKNILIEKEVPVPYKHIYLPKAITNELEIWCFKQDICVFEELFHKDIKYKDAKIIDSEKKEILNVKLEKDSAQNSHHVGLPYVIIETKMGKSINTHELLAYAQKVQMIKTIFPYVEYFLLFFGKSPARSYRHGVDFDEIIELDDLTDSTIDLIKDKITIAYKKSLESIKNIFA